MDDKLYLIVALGIVAVVGITAMVIFSKNGITTSSAFRMTPEQYFGGGYGQQY